MNPLTKARLIYLAVLAALFVFYVAAYARLPLGFSDGPR